jgi:DNA-binding transcriptional ArsR family regulator
MEHPDVRTITDSRVLAAMTHPLRRRLLSMLKVDGPSTASVLAERTGQGVGNISHHLRVLATAGLIEEVPELARDRREHWWRRVGPALQWSSTDFAGDPAGEAVAIAAESLNLDLEMDVIRRWVVMQAEEQEQDRWPHGPFGASTWMRVTDDELVEVGREMLAIMRRWADRELPDDGQDRATVLVVAHGVPGEL